MEMRYSLWPKKKAERCLLQKRRRKFVAGEGAGLSLTFMRTVPAMAGAGGMLSAGAPPKEGQHETSHPDAPTEWSKI